MNGDGTQTHTLRGRAFENTIDGYFPLRESLRQMLVRNRIQAAWICLMHAPAMEVPGLAPDDPVPLYITAGHGCLIRHMSLFVTLDGDELPAVTGVADWTWWGNHRARERTFSVMHRLAEPAFLRGIAFETCDCLDRDPPGITETENIREFDVTLRAKLVKAHIVRGTARYGNRTFTVEPTGSPAQATQDLRARIACGAEASQQRILEDLLNQR